MRNSTILAIGLLAIAIGCSKKEQASGWYLDASFSERLISFWDDQHPIITTGDPAKSVAALQIFRAVKGKHYLYTVDEIRSLDLVYETRKSEDIVSLFRATRNRSDKECNITEYDYVFFILAFDRDLMRVGFVKYFPCRRNDLGHFQIWGSNSLYFSSDLATALNKVISSGLQRRIDRKGAN